MTIWILALVLLAAGAGLGLRQGAIRAVISFVGIVTAAIFAGMLGHLLKPLLLRMGLQNPVLIWMLAPLIAFFIVLFVFKVIGFFVHQKVYLFYKYKAGDLRRALWERLNSRLGLCAGLLNGAAYLLLLSFAIYNVSYWTIQIAGSSQEPFVLRALNRMGNDLDATGLAAPARSLVSLPAQYYRMANLAGLLRQNPQLADRLENYPAFLSLAENSDFKSLGQDSSFQSAWKKQAPLGQLLNNSQLKTIIKNSQLTSKIDGLLQSNWSDLDSYLKTGKSAKYDPEKILGRWSFDLNASLGALLLANPKIRPSELAGVRSLWSEGYAHTTFIAAPDHQAFLRNIPQFKVEKKTVAVAKQMKFQGQWRKEGTNYTLSLSGNGPSKTMTAHTDGQQLTIKSGNDTWVFEHQ